MPTIDINKTYTTHDGRKVKIYTTEHPGEQFPVIGSIEDSIDVYVWSSDGVSPPSYCRYGNDLVEYHPANDWPVDHPIWVRDNDGEEWDPRHFAKFEGGKIYAWSGGITSHTSVRHDNNITHWVMATDVNPFKE
jgi:hypothetical protein